MLAKYMVIIILSIILYLTYFATEVYTSFTSIHGLQCMKETSNNNYHVRLNQERILVRSLASLRSNSTKSY